MKKPTRREQKAARDLKHFSLTVTPKQAARMRSGRTESVPEDYESVITEDAARLRDARHAVEDRRMAQEAGL